MVKKSSGASEYKLDLPGGTKVYHALWKGGGVEAFLKHVMSAESYIKCKGYFGEYDESKKEHTKAVLLGRMAKDIFLASTDVPKGVVLKECKTLAEAKTVVEETNALRISVAGKMFAL